MNFPDTKISGEEMLKDRITDLKEILKVLEGEEK